MDEFKTFIKLNVCLNTHKEKKKFGANSKTDIWGRDLRTSLGSEILG